MSIRRVCFKEKFTSNEIRGRPQILVKLSLRDLCDSKLSGGLGIFGNMTISLSKTRCKIRQVDC